MHFVEKKMLCIFYMIMFYIKLYLLAVSFTPHKLDTLHWPTSQMADRILKFMMGHLGLGSNVQLGLVDFKVCDWPPETGR